MESRGGEECQVLSLSGRGLLDSWVWLAAG